VKILYSKITRAVRGSRNRLKDYVFTSESVSEGHPDKVCDQISDSILDLFLKHDPQSRVAIEAMVAPKNVIVAGEVKSLYKPDAKKIDDLIRRKIKEIGYNAEPFNSKTLKITNLIHEQSPEISMGVTGDASREEGAGDQGIMFGYACRETDEFMPAPIYYSHKIMKKILDATKTGKLKGLLGPDAKCQVSLQYGKDKMPYRASAIIVSIQHKDILSQSDVKRLITPYVIESLPGGWMCDDEHFFVNPTGSFTIGGPQSDAGLTGRKIIVDTYGGAAPHGGGAFSGKDPSKVDRSAAYAARYLAKNIVAAGLSNKCLIQISYSIGVAKPVSLYVDCSGTANYKEKKIIEAINSAMNLSPRGIRDHLHLDAPIYTPTASYGHFGRHPGGDGTFTWEKLDLVDELKALVKK
jgi:S-adenosylmethionine synthetase